MTDNDRDVTPRRIVSVPDPDQLNSAGGANTAATNPTNSTNPSNSTSAPQRTSTPAPRTNRFVFGQEIPEATMIREFTVPGAPVPALRTSSTPTAAPRKTGANHAGR